MTEINQKKLREFFSSEESLLLERMKNKSDKEIEWALAHLKFLHSFVEKFYPVLDNHGLIGGDKNDA